MVVVFAYETLVTISKIMLTWEKGIPTFYSQVKDYTREKLALPHSS